MMEHTLEWVAENKEKLEKGVEFLGQVSEVLASTVGQLHPVLEAVFNGIAELLKNPESKDGRYLAKQFARVHKQLDNISDDMGLLSKQVQKMEINIINFDYEANLMGQYDRLQDFINIDPEYKEIKKEKFLKHYEVTQRDLNLDALYNAVTGDNHTGKQLLVEIMQIEGRSRRVVEDFCAGLKRLFVLGIISTMAYASLKHGAVGEKMVKKWQARMEDLEKRMKAAVDECIEKFPEQAKEDVDDQLQKYPGTINDSLTTTIMDALVKKYDWVNWSIRAFNKRERFFIFDWLAGKKYEGKGGNNSFLVPKSNIMVVVSFCVDPKPINKTQMQEMVEQKKLKGDMETKALALKERFPNCLVHAVSHFKTVVEANNFKEDCYYYGKHQGAYLCIHPE